MKFIEFIEGKWLGHPLHPALVHVPLGLWLGACVMDILVVLGIGESVLPRLSFYAVLVGLLGALIAIAPGAADWAQIKKDKPAWKLGLYHMLLNLVAVVVWAGNFGLRFNTLDTPRAITPTILTLSVIGSLLLIVSGYIGSLMVFDQGIGIGRFSKKKWRKLAVQAGSHVPEEK